MTSTLKNIVFAAGDVGGARALLPVIHDCESQGIPFGVIAHGHISSEAEPHWPLIHIPEKVTGDEIYRTFLKESINTLVFGSSVHDTFPLTLAREAKKMRIPVIHILDNWTAYRHRIEHDGLPMLIPDIYTVMDEVAYNGAVADGIDPSVLHITGQPALATLAQLFRTKQGKQISGEGRRKIVFVSEPVAADQGYNDDFPNFRGYTEEQVITLLCKALQPYKNEVTLSLLPHPREKVEPLHYIWEAARGNLEGNIIVDGKEGRHHIIEAHGIAGMASILLYDAWLIGKPVISIQPNLKIDAFRMLQKRDGVQFVDNTDLAEPIMQFVQKTGKKNQEKVKPELNDNANAPNTIMGLVKDASGHYSSDR